MEVEKLPFLEYDSKDCKLVKSSGKCIRMPRTYDSEYALYRGEVT